MALPVTLYWYPRSTHSIWAADTVQITAQSRHKFTGWPTGTGLIHHLVMPNGPLRIEASYRLEHRVTVSAVPVAGGTVSGDGWYPEGSTATLEATPAAGYRFVRYTDPVESPLPISPLTVTGPLTVTALFDLALVAP